jgi:hypothetical protein
MTCHTTAPLHKTTLPHRGSKINGKFSKHSSRSPIKMDEITFLVQETPVTIIYAQTLGCNTTASSICRVTHKLPYMKMKDGITDTETCSFQQAQLSIIPSHDEKHTEFPNHAVFYSYLTDRTMLNTLPSYVILSGSSNQA